MESMSCRNVLQKSLGRFAWLFSSRFSLDQYNLIIFEGFCNEFSSVTSSWIKSILQRSKSSCLACWMMLGLKWESARAALSVASSDVKWSSLVMNSEFTLPKSSKKERRILREIQPFLVSRLWLEAHLTSEMKNQEYFLWKLFKCSKLASKNYRASLPRG